jgi:hypothetical protein
LYYNGVCTKDSSADSGSTYYAISGFIEEPFITLTTCTHLKVLEQDAKLVAACKEHGSSDITACKAESYVASSGGDCYYEILDRSTCEAGNEGDTTTATLDLQACQDACTADFYCN